MALSREEFNKLRTQGLSVDQILKFEQGNIPESAKPKKKGFFGRVTDDVKNRFSNIAENQQDFAENTRGVGLVESQKQLAQTGLRNAGQIAGVASDILGEGLVTAGRGVSALTPDAIENPIKERFNRGVSKIARSDSAQKVASFWTRFAEENPDAAENLKAFYNIAEGFGAGKILSVGVKGVANKGVLETRKQLANQVAKKNAKVTQKLADDLSPKLTLSEKGQAIREGRVVEGSTNILTGKKPDTILPSKDVDELVKLVQKEIKPTKNLVFLILRREWDNRFHHYLNLLSPLFKRFNLPKKELMTFKKKLRKPSSVKRMIQSFSHSLVPKKLKTTFKGLWTNS